MKKMQWASSKREKFEHQALDLAHAAMKRIALRITGSKKKLLEDPVKALPTPDSSLPGALLHIDFSFYSATSMRGFALVLDAICAFSLC